MWCNNDGIFNYQECENEVEVKVWFHKMIEDGFYNLSVFERKVNNES